jgi:hypothetical protein
MACARMKYVVDLMKDAVWLAGNAVIKDANWVAGNAVMKAVVWLAGNAISQTTSPNILSYVGFDMIDEERLRYHSSPSSRCTETRLV